MRKVIKIPAGNSNGAQTEKGAQEMSKSRANELLQILHSKMTARFAGKDKEFCANNAYDLCREIIKEVDSEQVQSQESER